MSSMWDQLPGYAQGLRPYPANSARNSELPKALRIFWGIMYEQGNPPCIAIAQLQGKMRVWMRSDNGRAGMNRSFASWRTRSPNKLSEMIEYFKRPDVCSLFARQGATATLNQLRRGLSQIVDGERADVAFESLDRRP